MGFKSYWDDSEDDGSKMFGVGGFIGPDRGWSGLESRWLSALPTGINYFHSTDCFSGNGQFEPKKGFPVKQRAALLDKLSDVICETDVKLICHAIDVPKYMHFAPKRIENDFLGNKYRACFEACIQSACRDYMQPSNSPEPKETGDVCNIYYENSEYSHSVQRALRDLRGDALIWWRSRVGTATPGTKAGPKAIPLLQVADLGAFLGTKHVSDAPDGRIPWRPYYQKLVSAGRVWTSGRITRSSLGFLYALFQTREHPEILDEVWDGSDKEEKEQ